MVGWSLSARNTTRATSTTLADFAHMMRWMVARYYGGRCARRHVLRMVVKESMSSVLPSWVSSSQDASHHNPFKVCDDGRSRGVGVFEPGKRTAKMPHLIESGHVLGCWWFLRFCSGMGVRKDSSMWLAVRMCAESHAMRNSTRDWCAARISLRVLRCGW